MQFFTHDEVRAKMQRFVKQDGTIGQVVDYGWVGIKDAYIIGIRWNRIDQPSFFSKSAYERQIQEIDMSQR